MSNWEIILKYHMFMNFLFGLKKLRRPLGLLVLVTTTSASPLPLAGFCHLRVSEEQITFEALPVRSRHSRYLHKSLSL